MCKLKVLCGDCCVGVLVRLLFGFLRSFEGVVVIDGDFVVWIF